MNLQTSIFIWWKNKLVGQLNDPIIDMGYIEGAWQPNQTTIAKEFNAKAELLVARQVLSNPGNGFRIKLSEASEDEPRIYAYVLELINGILLIKMVSDNEAIEDFLKIVHE